MLFYLIFWLYRSEQEGSDRLPHFPKAAQFTVLLCICLLSYYHTQTENVGQKKKKKVYSLPTILLYENGTIASLSGDVTPPECVTFSLYNNKEFAP